MATQVCQALSEYWPGQELMSEKVRPIPAMPRVSVLMAAYNAERYVDQAIESLLAQTYQNWELIVVDDGSTDSTPIRLQAWAERDSRIRFYRNNHNLGIGPTRQRALDLARGTYAAILDSDDIALPEWLAARVDHLDHHPEVVVVSGSRIVIDESGKRVCVIHEGGSPEVLHWRLLFGNPVSQPSCMFRVAEAGQVGGYITEPYLEDWDLFVKLSELGQIEHVNVALMMYRVHPSKASLRIGTNRELLEPVATRIMCRTVKSATGLTVPTELVWYLFRGRYVFRGNRRESQRALDFVLQAHRAFAEENNLGSQSTAVGATAIEDAVNVLRCGGWSPLQAVKALASIISCAGISTLLSPVGSRGAIKLLLAPVRQARSCAAWLNLKSESG